MKFSGHLPLDRDTSVIDFGPDRSIPLAGHTPKVGKNELNCFSVSEWDRNFQRSYRYVVFNDLVLAVPKTGQMSKSGTFPQCKIVLVLRFFVCFCHPCIRK